MMEIDPPSNFASKDDEVRYWMDVAHQMCQRKEEIEREMTEFQENSLLYEKELETSFEQTDKRNRDLSRRNEKLEHENAQLKLRLGQQMSAQTKLQAQLQEQKRCSDQLVACMRKLEQRNDDLERANRESKTAEEELEMQFNSVLEKLALLETDVDEKEGLKIAVQRLKDENKELKQQIQVEIRQHSGNSGFRSSLRLQSRRNSAASNAFRFTEEESHTQRSQPHSNKDIFKYVRELEQKVDNLENAQRISKVAEEDLASRFNMAVEKIALLETELSDKENFQATIQKLKDENRDLSQEMEVRLRAHKSKTVLERTRSHSISNKVQEEKPRSSTSNRVSRTIENRVKKVKEEEKRQQNLTWFLKRLRYSQPNWMRKKEQN